MYWRKKGFLLCFLSFVGFYGTGGFPRSQRVFAVCLLPLCWGLTITARSVDILGTISWVTCFWDVVLFSLEQAQLLTQIRLRNIFPPALLFPLGENIVFCLCVLPLSFSWWAPTMECLCNENYFFRIPVLLCPVSFSLSLNCMLIQGTGLNSLITSLIRFFLLACNKISRFCLNLKLCEIFSVYLQWQIWAYRK